MTQADRIRKFVLDRYISPARETGRGEITVRAGDVHQAMGLRNAMPAVCSAIGSVKFDELARVARGKRIGPANGANVYFIFFWVFCRERRWALMNRSAKRVAPPGTVARTLLI